jgi:hypothetical protein
MDNSLFFLFHGAEICRLWAFTAQVQSVEGEAVKYADSLEQSVEGAMKDLPDGLNEETHETSLDRRSFLTGLGKWSCVVIATVSAGPFGIFRQLSDQAHAGADSRDPTGGIGAGDGSPLMMAKGHEKGKHKGGGSHKHTHSKGKHHHEKKKAEHHHKKGEHTRREIESKGHHHAWSNSGKSWTNVGRAWGNTGGGWSNSGRTWTNAGGAWGNTSCRVWGNSGECRVWGNGGECRVWGNR